MAQIILSMAVVAEIAFATYCIATKSRQTVIRDWMRVGAWALFIILALVSVIRWNFTWYALALLLTVWAGFGIWGLVKRRSSVYYGAGTMVRKAIGTLVLLALVLVPAFIFPQHRPVTVTGPHPVATVSFTYTDPNRLETFTHSGAHRQVNVECWYPKDGMGKYPLVLFSHGSLGTKLQNASTFTELASNGYVVCSIEHPYIALYSIGADGHLVLYSAAFYHQLVNVNAGDYDAATAFQIEQNWMHVPISDIKLVLDTIVAQANNPQADGVYRLIDTTKIGLMGHSLGGESMVEVARERKDMISAVVNLDSDPDGEYLDFINGREVLRNGRYPLPILSILADDLAIPISKIPDAKDVVAVEHIAATGKHAFLVHIQGTNHFSMTDVPIVSPFLESMLLRAVPKADGTTRADKYYALETSNHLVLLFFNAFLKGQGTFAPAPTY